MKKIASLLILITVLAFGCSSSDSGSYYVKPMDFTKSEMAILELSQMNDPMLYLEYSIPENYKVLGFWIETYENNQLIDDSGVLHGLGENDHEGILVIQMSDEDTYHLQVKQLNEQGSGYSLSTFDVDKVASVKEARGKSESFLIEAVEFEDATEIVLAVYTYDNGSGMRALSPEDLQEYGEGLEDQSLYVLLKMKLKESF